MSRFFNLKRLSVGFMKIIFALFLICYSMCVCSEEYTVLDKVDKDGQGRVNYVTRTIRLSSEDLLHREKAKLILYREAHNIFQFWGGHFYIHIKGVGKIDYVNEKGKVSRKYSPDAVIFSLAKEFSHLYFYDSELGIEIEATDLFPALEREKSGGFVFESEADTRLQETIKRSGLEAEQKMRKIEEEAELRRRRQREATIKAQEDQRQLEKRYRNSGSIFHVIRGLFCD